MRESTKWIICMWDIRGDKAEDTAMVLKRKLSEIEDVIAECKANGYYDKVKRHIKNFDESNATVAINSMESVFGKRVRHTALRGETNRDTYD